MPVIRVSANQYEFLCKHAEELGQPVAYLLHDLITMWKKSWVEGRQDYDSMVMASRIETIENGFEGPVNPDGTPKKFITLFEQKDGEEGVQS